MFRSPITILRRALPVAAVALVAALPLLAPSTAHAWWRGGWGWGGGVFIAPPAVVVGPPAVYAPPPVVYGAPPYYGPARVWVPGHWWRGYWVRGHWA